VSWFHRLWNCFWYAQITRPPSYSGPLSAGQCRDLFFSRWCCLLSSRGRTTAIWHSLAFHHISCHGCRQWWTPPLGSSFPRQDSRTSLRSFFSCAGWRLQSVLHSNNQSWCTSVYRGPHLHTLLTSFVRWQMSRLVSSSSSLIVSHTRLLTVFLPVPA